MKWFSGSKEFISRVINAMGRQTDNKHGRGTWKVHVLAPKKNIMAGVLKRRVRAHVTEVVACMFLWFSEYGAISQWSL